MLKATNEGGLATLAQSLRSFVRETPLVMLQGREFGSEAQSIALKLELLQYAGSVKVRVAEAFCQTLATNVTTVVTACEPEDAIALALVARRRGLVCRIHVDTTTPFSQVANMRRFYPDLVFDHRANVKQRRVAKIWARRYGAAFYDPERQQIALQALATLGLELGSQLRQVNAQIDTLLVPVATGATLAGLAKWQIWHKAQDNNGPNRIKLVGVEAQRTPALFAANKKAHVCRVNASGITVGRLMTRAVSPLVFKMTKHVVAKTVLVSDADIVWAQKTFWSRLRLAADAKGALGLAALMSGAYVPQKGERVGVLIPSSYLGSIDFDQS
ncbi:MAG: pyridoxal-phosphate dependent enzyme [Hyphomicrobiaceae bacterium]